MSNHFGTQIVFYPKVITFVKQAVSEDIRLSEFTDS